MNQTELFTQVRVQIKDAVGTPRWANATLRPYAQNCLDLLHGTHPEAFMEDSIVTSRPLRLTGDNESTDMGITVSYQDAVVHFVAAQALLEDRDHAGNVALAESHMSQYTQLVG